MLGTGNGVNMKRIYSIFFLFVGITTIFLTIFQNANHSYVTSTKDYLWPAPGYHQISSYFGYRDKPTQNASSYHQGVDILALEGSGVLAIAEGKVVYAGWHTYGGYTVKIEHAKNLFSIYEHLSPNMIVRVGDYVQKGEVIAKVGPKYVAEGKLNGATTGVHLHFGINKDGKYVDPLAVCQ